MKSVLRTIADLIIQPHRIYFEQTRFNFWPAVWAGIKAVGTWLGTTQAGNAVLATGASALTNKGQAKATTAQNKVAADLADETNRLNYQMYNEARGSEGNAVLPLYMGNTESGLANDIMAIYNKQKAQQTPYTVQVPQATGTANAVTTPITNAAGTTPSAVQSPSIPQDIFLSLSPEVIDMIMEQTVFNMQNPDQAINPYDALPQEVMVNTDQQARTAIENASAQWESQYQANLAANTTGTGTNTTGETQYNTVVVDPTPAGLQAADANYNNLIGAMTDQGQMTVDAFNDNIMGDRMGYLDTISQTRKTAANTAVNEAMARLKAARSAPGIGGGSSSFSANQLAGSILQAEQQSSVQDALDRARVYDENVNMKLGMFGQPLSTAQQGYDFGYLPNTYDYKNADELLKRLNFFNIGTGSPPATETPSLSPVPNNAMILGGALSSGAGAISDYYSTQAIINAINNNKSSDSFLPSNSRIVNNNYQDPSYAVS